MAPFQTVTTNKSHGSPENGTYNSSSDVAPVTSSVEYEQEQAHREFWEALFTFGQLRPVTTLGWFQFLLTSLCCFGVSGNLVTLIVLIRKQLRTCPGKLETSANIGLASLAVSDLLCCVVVLPYSFLPDSPQTPLEASMTAFPDNKRDAFFLYYSVYGVSAISLFIMTSTWLILVLAIERYIVLYYPFQAKTWLSVRRTEVVIGAVYVISVLFTLPYFINFRIRSCIGLDSRIRLERVPQLVEGSNVAHVSRIFIQHVWPAVAVFLPLAVLVFCNVALIQGLRKVRKTRRLSCPGQSVKEGNVRITLTLIIIVATALLLVTPAAIFKVLNPYSLLGPHGTVVSAVLNLLQTVSFAFNFVLYCVVDKHFRLMCRMTLLSHCTACSRRNFPRVNSKDLIMLQRQGTGSSTLHS